MKEKANIEELKWSLIAPDVCFTSAKMTMQEIIDFRRNNLKITQMIWITKQPVLDCSYNLYNPKALIMLILN